MNTPILFDLMELQSEGKIFEILLDDFNHKQNTVR